MLRATFETLPDGGHLLVGNETDDLDEFTSKIKTALLWGRRVDIRPCGSGQRLRHAAHGWADRGHQHDQPSAP